MSKDHQNQAKNLIGSLMNQIAGQGEKSSSWPVMLIFLSVFVIFISILGIKLAWAKRVAVKLAIQVRRVEEEKKRVEEDAKLSENSVVRQAAQEKITTCTKEVLKLKAQIAKRYSEQKEMADQLKSITSWDDIVVVNIRDQL